MENISRGFSGKYLVNSSISFAVVSKHISFNLEKSVLSKENAFVCYSVTVIEFFFRTGGHIDVTTCSNAA